MKVRVTIELEVDPVLWAQEYHLGSLSDVPGDVRRELDRWQEFYGLVAKRREREAVSASG